MHTSPGITPSIAMPRYGIMSLTILVLFLAAVVGCTSKEKAYENMYEGLKMREQLVNPSQEPVPPRPPDYNEYKRHREKILQENREEQK